MEVLTQDNFDKTIKNGLVIIDFFAEWCGPCHALTPLLDEISKRYEGKISFYKLDVDNSSQIAAKYQVMSIPTVIFFKNGTEVNKIIGAQPESRYTDVLEEMLKD